jgi:hypothetical protein
MARSRRKDAVAARAYLSPTLVLLAFDWPSGAARDDFLGFAIERTPSGTLKRSPLGRPESTKMKRETSGATALARPPRLAPAYPLTSR